MSHPTAPTPEAAATCATARPHFSDYLDGALTGVQMAALSHHFDACPACAAEFLLWRQVQAAVAGLGVAPPRHLQRQLHSAIALERERGTHLSVLQQARRGWATTFAPMALRVTGGLVAALILAGGLGFVFGAPIQANDDRLAHLVAPRYLSSVVPPQPILTHYETPIVVQAQVDTAGRVYDFAILAGPQDRQTLLGVEANLLNSNFAPATVFGVPVRGHVLLTYTGVSVHG